MNNMYILARARGRADTRRRDAVDVIYRRGAATQQMPARRRAIEPGSRQAERTCYSSADSLTDFQSTEESQEDAGTNSGDPAAALI